MWIFAARYCVVYDTLRSTPVDGCVRQIAEVHPFLFLRLTWRSGPVDPCEQAIRLLVAGE